MFKRRISMEFYFFAKFLSLLRFFLQNRDIDRSIICFEFISDSSTRNLDREEHLFFHQCSTIPVEKINEVKKGEKKSSTSVSDLPQREPNRIRSRNFAFLARTDCFFFRPSWWNGKLLKTTRMISWNDISNKI